MNARHEFGNPISNGKVIDTNVDPAVYHRSNGDVPRGDPRFIMSNSELMDLLEYFPKEWIAGVEHKDTKATRWGTAMDAKWLTPALFAQNYVVLPPDAPRHPTKAQINAAKPSEKTVKDIAWWKEFEAANPKAQVLPATTMTEMALAIGRLNNKANAKEIMECSQKQVFCMAEYHDGETGLVIPLKSLMDMAPAKEHPRYGAALADMKCIRNTKEHAWRRQVYDNRYMAQAALYLDVWNSATNDGRCCFFFILSKNAPPYTPAVRQLSMEFLAIGREWYLSALRTYCRCLASGHWPDEDEMLQSFDGIPITEPELWMTTTTPILAPMTAEAAQEDPESDNHADDRPKDMIP